MKQVAEVKYEFPNDGSNKNKFESALIKAGYKIIDLENRKYVLVVEE